MKDTNLTATDAVSTKEIPISQLKMGMYVLSMTTTNKNICIKSAGYVSRQQGVDKLIKSGVTRVVIDPSKTKASPSEDSDAISSSSTNDDNDIPSEQDFEPKISLDQEMEKASLIYQNAKSLQRQIIDDLAQGNAIDSDAVKETSTAIVDSVFRNQDALTCMSRLRLKDDYFLEHSLNASILMGIFCKHLKIERNLIEQLTLGAFLHDIGKVQLNEPILNKKGKYSEADHAEMQKHVSFGVKILEDMPNVSHIVMSMVKEHHERLDGSGYPFQLKGDAISKYGRMIAIVDSYDAMTADKPYRDSVHPIKAFKNLLEEDPGTFDEELVEQFIHCIGLYPVGTLVKLTSGKLGLISKLNKNKPLQPYVRVFYNSRLKQAIPMDDLDLSKPKYHDQIDCCIKPEEFNLNLLAFFKTAFVK